MHCQAGMVPAIFAVTAVGKEGSKLCSQSCPGKMLTFGFTDHHIAELAFTSFIEALHLNVI